MAEATHRQHAVRNHGELVRVAISKLLLALHFLTDARHTGTTQFRSASGSESADRSTVADMVGPHEGPAGESRPCPYPVWPLHLQG
eukprot:1187907-Prorocentrum_minimum.AAC.4